MQSECQWTREINNYKKQYDSKIFMDGNRAYRLNNHIHVGDFTRSGSSAQSKGKGGEVAEKRGNGMRH
jgi:hypothetical protein